MGMWMGFVSLSDRNIDRLLSDQPLVWKVVSDDPQLYTEERRKEEIKRPFLSRVFGKPPPDVEELRFEEGEMVGTDVDKAWHFIHVLLTGTAFEGHPPLNFI